MQAAREIDGPVVVKPVTLGGGRGISVNIRGDEPVALAFRRAARHDRVIAVEEYVPGNDHRILVIDGSVVAVAQRKPAQVIGVSRMP